MTTKPPLKENPVLPKIWITKYALTKGIYTATNATHVEGISTRMVTFDHRTASGYRSIQCFHKPHWHLTEDEARDQVQKMVNNALKALKKKGAKLDALMASVEGPVPTKPWNQG